MTFGDVSGDGRADAIGRNPLTGVVLVGVSNGQSFGTMTPWGTWPAVQVLGRPQVADVNYDGYGDLVMHDGTSGGQIRVALSSGSSLAASTVWATWSNRRDFHLGDLSGDGRADLFGRDQDTQVLHSLDSTGTAFAGALTYGTLGTGYQLRFGDANGDGYAEYVGRSTSNGEVRVGFSESSTAPSEAWGTFDPAYEVLLADVNGDGSDDLLGRQPSTGDLRYSASLIDSYEASQAFGNFPAQFVLYPGDVDGDGKDDLIGHNELTGQISVAASTATAPSGLINDGEYEPDPTLVPELEDPLATTSGSETVAVFLSHPRLGFSDGTTLLSRVNLSANEVPANRVAACSQQVGPVGNPPVIPQDKAFLSAGQGGCEDLALEEMKDTVNRMKQSGATTIRFSANWDIYEDDDAGSRDYTWDKLDRAVNFAITHGLTPIMTISGTVKLPTCAEVTPINPDARLCEGEQASGINPNDVAYGRFVKDTVNHFKNPIRTYSLWNEPNLPGEFLATTVPANLPVALYRKLYKEGRRQARMEYGSVRVLIGELSSKIFWGRMDTATSGPREQFTPARFLAEVANGEDLRTEGVAFHPYQHIAEPARCAISYTGIGSLAPPRATGSKCLRGTTQKVRRRYMQTMLDYLAKDASDALRTQNEKRPPLLLTEFGYYNRPKQLTESKTSFARTWNVVKDWHPEQEKANRMRTALRLASQADARSFVFFQAVEAPPQDYNFNPSNPEQDISTCQNSPAGSAARERCGSFFSDQGLISKNAEVTGNRGYGHPGGWPPANYAAPSPRKAYCAVFNWAFGARLHNNSTCGAPLPP